MLLFSLNESIMMKDFSTNACWWNFKSQINFYKHDKKYLILFQITVSITRSWYSTTQLFNQYKKLLRSFHIDDYNGEGREKFNFKMNSSFLPTLSRLFQFAKKVKCRRISLELISWEPHSSLERDRKIRRRWFTSSIKVMLHETIRNDDF